MKWTANLGKVWEGSEFDPGTSRDLCADHHQQAFEPHHHGYAAEWIALNHEKAILLPVALLPGRFSLRPGQPAQKTVLPGDGKRRRIGARFLYTGIVTNYGDDVVVYEGGGMPSLDYGLGYTLNDHYHISLIYCYQSSEKNPLIANGSAYFNKNMLDLELRYIFRMGRKHSHHINAGAGMINFVKCYLDADFSAIAGWTHEIYSYNYAAGMKWMTEYEWFARRRRFSFGFGMEYMIGNLHLGKITYDGIPVSPATFAPDSGIHYTHIHSFDAYIRLGWHWGK